MSLALLSRGYVCSVRVVVREAPPTILSQRESIPSITGAVTIAEEAPQITGSVVPSPSINITSQEETKEPAPSISGANTPTIG